MTKSFANLYMLMLLWWNAGGAGVGKWGQMLLFIVDGVGHVVGGIAAAGAAGSVATCLVGCSGAASSGVTIGCSASHCGVKGARPMSLVFAIDFVGKRSR